MLYRWKAKVQKRCSSSVVIIEYYTVKEKNYLAEFLLLLKFLWMGFLEVADHTWPLIAPS
jgi:hypothetical protein